MWFILGGFLMGCAWWLAGLLAFLSVIGIPWGRACFAIGRLAFFPFGREAISREELTAKGDVGTGAFGTLANIVWFFLLGIWLTIGYLTSALACAITIVGIPFALQHLKLAGLTLPSCPLRLPRPLVVKTVTLTSLVPDDFKKRPIFTVQLTAPIWE